MVPTSAHFVENGARGLTVRGVTPAASAEFVQRRPDCLVRIGRDLIARLAKRPVAEEINFDALVVGFKS
jgi:hypothetical protein